MIICAFMVASLLCLQGIEMSFHPQENFHGTSLDNITDSWHILISHYDFSCPRVPPTVIPVQATEELALQICGDGSGSQVDCSTPGANPVIFKLQGDCVESTFHTNRDGRYTVLCALESTTSVADGRVNSLCI